MLNAMSEKKTVDRKLAITIVAVSLLLGFLTALLMKPVSKYIELPRNLDHETIFSLKSDADIAQQKFLVKNTSEIQIQLGLDCESPDAASRQVLIKLGGAR
jgi:hypothetical protein